MVHVDFEFATENPASPKFARQPRLVFGVFLHTDRNGQIQPQSKQCNFAIVMLAATLTRLSTNTRLTVGDYDSGFSLVSMLSTRAASTCPLRIAVNKQFCWWHRRWMESWVFFKIRHKAHF